MKAVVQAAMDQQKEKERVMVAVQEVAKTCRKRKRVMVVVHAAMTCRKRKRE